MTLKTKSKIQWTQFTGGPWLICTEVSNECVNCYSKALMETRLGSGIRQSFRKAGLANWETRAVWGKTAPRVLTKGFWDEARRVNKAADKAGTKPKWFPSLIDIFDEMPAGIIDRDGNKLDPVKVRADFWRLVFECQKIDWLILTKRPQNWRPQMMEIIRSFPPGHSFFKEPFWHWLYNWTMGTPPSNVRIGVSCGTQKAADERIPELLAIPSLCRFLSVEPMLEEIDFDLIERNHRGEIHLAIFGGESGTATTPRPCNVKWIRDGVRQCRDAGVAVFVKQMGSYVVDRNDAGYDGENPHEWPMDTRTIDLDPQIYQGAPVRVKLKDSKGGNMAEWPAYLRVRDPWPEMHP